ncbi:MAG: peptidase S15, partial [Acidimicrobiia bacterium]|nr:peptidase S15 [Acidimicrobiia bacterium]
SRLTLPVRRALDEPPPKFGRPEAGPPLAKTVLRPGDQSWTVVRDLVRDESRLEVVHDVGRYRIDDIDLEIETRSSEVYSFRADDYGSLRGETWWERRFERDDWKVRTVAHTVLTSDDHEFRIRAQLDAYEGDNRIHSKSWDERIGRDHL